jgi:hypothetical protein
VAVSGQRKNAAKFSFSASAEAVTAVLLVAAIVIVFFA